MGKALCIEVSLWLVLPAAGGVGSGDRQPEQLRAAVCSVAEGRNFWRASFVWCAKKGGSDLGRRYCSR